MVATRSEVGHIKMLRQGTLRRPLDIFDFVMHATPFVLVALKLLQMALRPGAL